MVILSSKLSPKFREKTLMEEVDDNFISRESAEPMGHRDRKDNELFLFIFVIEV